MLTEVQVNGVTLPLKQKEVKRGDNKGVTYVVFDLDKIPVADLERAYTSDKIKRSIIRPKFDALLQALWLESYDPEAKVLNEDEFISNVQQLSARGETLSEITDRLMETIDAMDSVEDPLELKALAQEAKVLREAMEKKRRKSKEEAAEAQAAVATA